MDLHTWLDKPENKGKAAWLAEQLGRSKGAISQWRDEGVPLPLITRVVELTGGQVTSEAMLQHKLACAEARPSEKQAG